jgi:hypothetical protein
LFAATRLACYHKIGREARLEPQCAFGIGKWIVWWLWHQSTTARSIRSIARAGCVWAMQILGLLQLALPLFFRQILLQLGDGTFAVFRRCRHRPRRCTGRRLWPSLTVREQNCQQDHDCKSCQKVRLALLGNSAFRLDPFFIRAHIEFRNRCFVFLLFWLIHDCPHCSRCSKLSRCFPNWR